MQTPHMLSPHEVAERCGVSYHAVLRAIHRGDLAAERLFNRLRVPEDALAEYRAAHRVQPSRNLRAPAPPPASASPPDQGSLAALRAIEEESDERYPSR